MGSPHILVNDGKIIIEFDKVYIPDLQSWVKTGFFKILHTSSGTSDLDWIVSWASFLTMLDNLRKEFNI